MLIRRWHEEEGAALRTKIPCVIVCVLLILALFAANYVLFQTPGDIAQLKEQEFTDKEKEMSMLDIRGTRSPLGWMDEVRLTYSSGDSTTPDMAVSGSNVHVVWRKI